MPAKRSPSTGNGSAAPSIAELTPISTVMTTDVTCVRADLPVEALAALLLERGISGTPVVDADGFPIGVISKTDIVRARLADHDDGATVGEIMMPLAFTLRPRESIARACALMAFEGIHRVAVVSETGHVVGVVTPLDVVRWLARPGGSLEQASDPAEMRDRNGAE